MPGINDSRYVLVIGATAGIGRALALAIHALPTKPTVIVAGRRKERLDELVKKGEGRIEAVQIDLSSGKEALKDFADDIVRKHPELDTIVFSAGVQRASEFKEPEKIDIDALFDEVNTNYLAVLALIKFFLPHFLKLSSGGRPTFFVPITSGLAMVPMTTVSNYCATKSALHSLSISLHNSLKDTNVHIMEILPPLVESELHDQQGTTEMLSKHWMPLGEFVKYAMEGLQRGDFNILVPSIKGVWEKVEAERIALSGKVPGLFNAK